MSHQVPLPSCPSFLPTVPLCPLDHYLKQDLWAGEEEPGVQMDPKSNRIYKKKGVEGKVLLIWRH